MAAIDFSAPVKVMVTIEDSDDDIIMCEDENDELISLGNSNNTLSMVSSPPTFEDNNEIFDEYEKLGNKRKENYRNKRNILKHLQDRCDINIETNSISEYLKKRFDSPPKSASNQNGLSKNNNYIIMEDLQKLIDSVRKTKHRTMDSENLRLSNGDNTKRYDGDTENYVSHLRNIRKHISFIMDAFFCFTRIKNSNPCDENLVHEAANYYNEIKKYFFTLSYRIIADIILPHMNNPSFIQNFINDTTTIVNEKNPCEHWQIATLLAEMVHWTIEKQKLLNNLPVQFEARNNSNQNNADMFSFLKQELLKPVPPKLPPKPNRLLPKPKPSLVKRKEKQANSYTKPQRKFKTKSPKCIFSCGPPGRNINISINPSLLNYQRGMSTDTATEALSHDYRPDFSRENIISQHEETYIPQYNNYNAIPPATTYPNNCCSSNPGLNILFRGQPYIAPCSYQNHVPVLTQLNCVPPPQYTEKHQREAQSQQNQPSRSTSTDSGFMSPLNFSTEPMVIFNLYYIAKLSISQLFLNYWKLCIFDTQSRTISNK